MLADAWNEDSKTNLISTFLIGTSMYGLETSRVQEIVRVGNITRVHHAPDYIIGIMNLRGKIVTVIDSGKKLILGKLTITDESRIIILEWKGEYVGLLVDTVHDVFPVEPERIVPSPANISNAQGRYFSGVYKQEEGGGMLVTLLDIDAVLSDEES